MTSDDRLFSLIQRISAIESQLVSRRSFLGDTDPVGARYYRELQELRRELDVRLGYGTHSTATVESPDDEITLDTGARDLHGVRVVPARVLGQRCAGSGVCSVRCWGSVAGRNSRGQRPEADVVAFVPKQPSGPLEVDFGLISLKTCPHGRLRANL